MDEIATIFRRAMVKRESREVGDMEVNKLQEELKKVKMDADYWRLAYDKLLKHIEHQDSYIRHLESQVWGGKTF
jgi:uncharacterized protein